MSSTFGYKLLVIVGVGEVDPLLNIGKHLCISIRILLLDRTLSLHRKISQPKISKQTQLPFDVDIKPTDLIDVVHWEGAVDRDLGALYFGEDLVLLVLLEGDVVVGDHEGEVGRGAYGDRDLL